MLDLGLFSDLQWWQWYIAAAILGIGEVLMPGAVLIWFAAGAAAVGTLLLIVPLPWWLQLLLFGALSALALGLWRRHQRHHPQTSTLPRLNRRAAQYIGQIVTLAEPIEQGTGKAAVGDSVWLVRGPDLPKGAEVRVVAAEGALLIVEPAGVKTQGR